MGSQGTYETIALKDSIDQANVHETSVDEETSERPPSYSVAQFLKAKCKDALEDGHRVKWKRSCMHAFSHIICLLAVIATLVGVTRLATGTVYDTDYACLPNGDFDVSANVGNGWDAINFFSITIGFGSYAFSKVKFIDITWDILIGRGGQILLALVSYKAFTNALLRIMEQGPVSYGTFEAIALQHGNLSALWYLSRDLLSTPGLRARATILWLVFSAAFTIAFPTFASAMSGYSANVEAFVGVEKNLLPFSEFRLVRYIIHDGWRVGLGGNYIVTAIPNDAQATLRMHNPMLLDNCTTYNPWQSYDSSEFVDWSTISNDCLPPWRVSSYTQNYGFYGQNSTNSSFTSFNGSNFNRTISLATPSLNISAYSLPYCLDYISYGPTPFFDYIYCMFSPNWETADTYYADPFSGPGEVLYTVVNSNKTYDLDYVAANGVCQQTSTYQWGFSFLMLFTTMVCLTVWTIGTYILSMDSYLNSRLVRAGWNLGSKRAVLDYAAAMRRDLDMSTRNDGDETSVIKGLKWTAEGRRKGRGGRIGYMHLIEEKELRRNRSDDIHLWWGQFSVKQWARAEKWWLFVLGVWLVVFLIVLFHRASLSLGLLFILFGMLWTICLGRATRSRWVVCAVFSVVGLLTVWVNCYGFRFTSYY